MTITGQSGAGMLDLFQAQPPVRHYLVLCPPGMLASGHQVKKFSSVQAFDGYIAEVRARGYVVAFDNPFSARVAAAHS